MESDIVDDFRWELLPCQDVTDSNPSARLQQASNFLEYRGFILWWDKIDDTVADDTVNAGIRKRDRGDRRLNKLRIRQASRFGVSFREINHILVEILAHSSSGARIANLRHVNSNGISFWAHLASRKKNVDAASTSKVDNCLSLVQLSKH